ncbi:MAG: hypothetical protein VYC32_04375, partial [Planctomycetota bacterium]|nr:hypothetical protein [Planctomycetota bacterium]
MKNARCSSNVRWCGLSVLLALCLFLVDLPLAAEDCINCRRGDVSDGQPYTGVINTSDCTLGNGRRYEIVRYVKDNPGPVTITTSGSCNTFMELMHSGCGGIGSNTNCPNSGALGINPQNSCLSRNLSPGTYYLCIFETTGANSCGSYTVTVTEEDAPPAPANDACVDAEELILEEASLGFGRVGLLENVDGSTASATADTEDATCGPSNAPGVWYMVVGTGEPMSAATCGSSYDTRLSLFSGGLIGDCANLSCIAQNDDSCGLQSRVNWISEADVIYYILVHGFSTSSGAYSLAVSSDMPPQAGDADGDGVNDDEDNCVDDSNPGQEDCDGDGVGDACSSQCNDTCDGAITLDLSTGSASVDGSTSWGAQTDAENSTCGASSAPGLWFAAEGRGGAMSATTCNDTSNYDTRLSVFNGDCGTLECVTENDDNCASAGTRSTVNWVGISGVTYYILVHGFSSNSGEFSLSVNAEEADCISLSSASVDQIAKTISLSWESPAPGGEFEVSVNGETVATTSERSYTIEAPEAGTVAYSVSRVGAADCSVGGSATLSVGTVFFSDDFESYADDVALEVDGGWFRDHVNTPEDASGFSVIS